MKDLDKELLNIIEDWGRNFEPATGSRGQGGLPVTGSVVDWEMSISKEGWEFYKDKLISDIKKHYTSRKEVEKEINTSMKTVPRIEGKWTPRDEENTGYNHALYDLLQALKKD